LNQCEPVGPSPQLGQGYTMASLLVGLTGAVRASDALAGRGLRLAQETGTERDVAWSLSRNAVRQIGLARLNDARLSLAHVVTVAEEVGDPPLVGGKPHPGRHRRALQWTIRRRAGALPGCSPHHAAQPQPSGRMLVALLSGRCAPAARSDRRRHRILRARRAAPGRRRDAQRRHLPLRHDGARALATARRRGGASRRDACPRPDPWLAAGGVLDRRRDGGGGGSPDVDGARAGAGARGRGRAAAADPRSEPRASSVRTALHAGRAAPAHLGRRRRLGRRSPRPRTAPLGSRGRARDQP